MLRASILSAAIGRFAKQGFFQTSFQDIASELGVSQSAIMNHYPDKLQLIEATVREVILRSHRVVAEAESPHLGAFERLVRYCDRTATWAISRPDEAQVLLLLYYMGAWNEEFRKVLEGIQQVARSRILTIISAGVREKVFRPGPSLENVTAIIHDWLLGAVLNEVGAKRLKKLPPGFRAKREALLRGLLGIREI